MKKLIKTESNERDIEINDFRESQHEWCPD